MEQLQCLLQSTKLIVNKSKKEKEKRKNKKEMFRE